MGKPASSRTENPTGASTRLLQDCHLRYRFRSPHVGIGMLAYFPFPRLDEYHEGSPQHSPIPLCKEAFLWG